MKFAAAVAAAAALQGVSAALVKTSEAGAGVAGKVHVDEAARATPEDIASCASFMRGVMESPEVPERAIERAMDECALSKREDDRNYVCLHFQEALKNAFASVPATQDLTPESFCEVSENYMLALRGASRVANVGSGPLINFKISKNCEPTVKSKFGGKDTMAASKVPDLWYGLCMNQDCAHYLPSRTRWCEVTEIPTHSASVCEAAMKFAKDGVAAMGKSSLTAKEACDLYGDFVTETGYDVEAYEHVVHGDTRSRVPNLRDKKRALASSRMVNNAGKHDLRDNAGSPVVKNAASHTLPGATLTAAAAATLAMALA